MRYNPAHAVSGPSEAMKSSVACFVRRTVWGVLTRVISLELSFHRCYDAKGVFRLKRDHLMAIKVECGDCGMTYNVKDEMDGKKIRCKECSAVIPVRAESGDEWGEEEEFQAPVRKTSKKKQRATEFGGRPLTVWIALGCVGMMLTVSLFAIIRVAFMDTSNIPPDVVTVLRVTVLIVVGPIVIVQATILSGLLKRKSGARFSAMTLAGLAICMLFYSLMKRFLAPDGDTVTLLLLVLGLTLRVTFIGCLLTPNATRHFNQ